MIRITKRFSFESAHALWNYDGPCRNIHGHSYVLYVTVAGHPSTNPDDTKLGMVIDFSLLKQIVNREIIDVFDHALMINANTPHHQLAGTEGFLGKVLALPYQPTCENMVADFAGRLQKTLPGHVRLVGVRLHETETAYAEWIGTDNY